ncbi:MAG: hypothetical protein R6X23_01100 [Acidimicrobiia bacterium]
MSARYRCQSCGNLTRFDVVITRRTREYHHFSVAGELEIEDRELLDEREERVSCRWCGAADAAIERLLPDPVSAESAPAESVGES